MAVFMLETLKLSKTLKSSRDDFNVLDNFNVSSIKTANIYELLTMREVTMAGCWPSSILRWYGPRQRRGS